MGLSREVKQSVQRQEEHLVLKHKRAKKGSYHSCIICKVENAVIKPYCMKCFDLQQQGISVKDFYHLE